MNTSMEMAVNLLSTLVVLAGMWGILAVVDFLAAAKNTATTQTTNTGRYTEKTIESVYIIAGYYKCKYRTQAAVSGHYQAAKNLRKQGVPLEVAMLILFDKRA